MKTIVFLPFFLYLHAGAVSLEKPRMSQIQLARISFALSSLSKIAEEWPWLKQNETCISVIETSRQWLLNCPGTDTRKFTKTDQKFLKTPIYYRDQNVLFWGQEIKFKDLAKAYPATIMIYHPKIPVTSMAKSRPWIYVTDLEALSQSHPAFDKNTKTEEWLSIFIHEFFHTRQFLVEDFKTIAGKIFSRKINPDNLSSLYKKNKKFRSLLESEFNLLQSAARKWPQIPQKEAIETLRSWFQIYRERKELLLGVNREYILEDQVYTYVEGTARYVESVFLTSPQRQSLEGIKNDPKFTSFKGMKGYKGMLAKKMGPKYFYAIGMHLGLLLDSAYPQWKKEVHKTPKWLVGIVEKAITKK